MDVQRLLTEHFEAGQLCKMGFANIDIIDSSKLKGTHQEISRTKENLKILIESLSEGFPTAVLSWRGDGGIVVCDGTGGYDILVDICDKLVNLLPYFNNARGHLNCLPTDRIHIRVVCHESDGIRNTGDPETLTVRALDDLVHNERKVGSKDHVVLTESVYRSLSPYFKKRFSQKRFVETPLGECYILDYHQSLSIVQINEDKSLNLRDWIINSVKERRFDQIDIFAYTNETLYTHLGPLPDVEIRVLSRNWLIEEREENKFNADFEQQQDTLGANHRELRRPWTKSDIIASTSKILLTKSAESLFHKINIRFYEDRPMIKGAILRNSKTQHCAAHVGFYEYEPNRLEGGSPYLANTWAGIWLSEDQGAQSAMIRTIQSYFDEQWEKGKTYDSLKEEAAKKETTDKQLSSLKSIWDIDSNSRYLIIIPGRKLEGRDFPTVAGEDLLALRTIEQLLKDINADVSIEIKLEPEFEIDYRKFKKKVEDWPGHIVYVCHRTLDSSVLEELAEAGFPFRLDIDKKTKIPRFTHIEFNIKLISPVDEPDNPEMKDFCIIAKCDRKGKNSKLFIVAGLHGIGTWGGAQYLSEPNHYLRLCEYVDQDNFASIIVCEFEVPQRVTNVKPVMGPERF